MTGDAVYPWLFWGTLPLLTVYLRGGLRYLFPLTAALALACASLILWSNRSVLEITWQCMYIGIAAMIPWLSRRDIKQIRRLAALAVRGVRFNRQEALRERKALTTQLDESEKALGLMEGRVGLVHVVTTKMEATDILQALGNAWKNATGVKGCLLLRRRPNGNWETSYDDNVQGRDAWRALLTERPDIARFTQIRRYTAAEKHASLRRLDRHLRPPFFLVPFVWEHDVLALGYVEAGESALDACGEELAAGMRFAALGLRRAHLYELMSERSRRDPLTGVFLRSVLLERLREVLRKYNRYQAPFFCALLDIDHFKLINDRLGHLAGDRALVHLTETAARLATPGVFLSRFGGDEFAVILEMKSSEEAARWLEQLRRAIHDSTLTFEKNTFGFTISVGMAGPVTASEAPDSVLDQADQALYAAKREGRNRLSFFKAG